MSHRGSWTVMLAAGAVALAGCAKKEAEASLVTTAAVERRDIVVEAQATGMVEPVDTVAVKSIAGGLVTRMPVEVGSMVKPGDLLVQIDTRDVRNQYEQARANLASAQAQLTVATAARTRAEQLGAQRIITAAEREAATASFAAAQAAVVTARTNLDIAGQRLEQATVRAQVAGTVISKPVSVGTVITSATSSASGGTTLLTIADLSRVRMRALVNETDIGNVQVGQAASVAVDAFPDRRFSGTVEKIEPQAVVEQSVTMFPVLVSLENPGRTLLPGMNGEVTMRVQERTDVIAVPNDAVRSVRDMATAAQALGMNADSVRGLMQAQLAGRGAVAGGARAAGAVGGAGAAGAAGADVGQSVPATDSACAAVTAAIVRAPGVQPALDSLRQQMRDGTLEMEAMRTQARALYARAGVDPRTAQGCQRRRGAAGGQSAGAGAARAEGQSVAGARGGAQGRAGGAQAGGSQAGGAAGGRRGANRGVVFVKDSAGWSPRFVQVGVSNFDYTEVRGDVRPGEQVALLGAALLQAQRQQQNERIRSVTGGPLGGGGAGAGGRGPRGGAGPRGGS